MGRPMQFTTDAAIDKAVGVFWRHGYAATTPQVLADELGIGKGSLYNTFESKHNLYGLALRRYCAMRLEALEEGLTAAGPVKPKLKTAVEQLTGVGLHQRGCLVVNATAELASADDEVAAVAGELFRGIDAAFRAAIRRGQASGEIEAGRDAAEVASGLLATVIGTSVLARSGESRARLNRIINAAVNGL